MTWLDIVLIVVLVGFLVAGFRLGSVWMTSCLAGGLFASFLVDTYTLSAAELLGGFAGAKLLAGLMLFAGGLACVLVPGFVLSKIFSGLLLGTVDCIVGLLAGACTGVLAVLLAMTFLLPRFPSVEKCRAWENSILAKPLQRFADNIFNNPRNSYKSLAGTLGTEAKTAFEPAAAMAEKEVKALTKKVTKKLKK